MPEVLVAVPFRNIAIGTHDEFKQVGVLRAALAEFISALIFVFAGQGSGMAYTKLTDGAPNSPAGLISAALAHGIGLFIGVAVASNISGGHVNPAVTFGAFIGGNITLFRGILYIIAQCLGSTVACLLLRFCTAGMVSIGHFLLSVFVFSNFELFLE